MFSISVTCAKHKCSVYFQETEKPYNGNFFINKIVRAIYIRSNLLEFKIANPRHIIFDVVLWSFIWLNCNALCASCTRIPREREVRQRTSYVQDLSDIMTTPTYIFSLLMLRWFLILFIKDTVHVLFKKSIRCKCLYQKATDLHYL